MHRNWRYIERAIRAGNCGYLLKDAPLEELVATVKKVANGESLLRREGENKRSSETSPATVERPRLAQLTSRERKILIYIASGRSNEYIAKRLGIAQQRVESHKETIRRKLGISSTAGLTKFAIANGLTELLEIPGDTPKD
jgi:DNA-binding NarL/FixJ family response regulator